MWVLVNKQLWSQMQPFGRILLGAFCYHKVWVENQWSRKGIDRVSLDGGMQGSVTVVITMLQAVQYEQFLLWLLHKECDGHCHSN